MTAETTGREQASAEAIARQLAHVRSARILGWLTPVAAVLFVVTLPLAFFALYMPSEAEDHTLLVLTNLFVAAMPFVIMLTAIAAWLFHKGGAYRAALRVCFVPVANMAAIAVLAALQ